MTAKGPKPTIPRNLLQLYFSTWARRLKLPEGLQTTSLPQISKEFSINKDSNFYKQQTGTFHHPTELHSCKLTLTCFSQSLCAATKSLSLNTEVCPRETQFFSGYSHPVHLMSSFLSCQNTAKKPEFPGIGFLLHLVFFFWLVG